MSLHDHPPKWAGGPCGRCGAPWPCFNLTWAASVQFLRPFMFRVIRVLDWPTYDGWLWLDGYELGSNGDAVSRRSVFVQHEGLG